MILGRFLLVFDDVMNFIYPQCAAIFWGSDCQILGFYGFWSFFCVKSIFCPKKVLFTSCTSIDFISLKSRFWMGFLKVRVKKYRYSTLCNTRPSYSLTQKGSQNRGVPPKSGGQIVSHYNLHGQESTTARFLFGILHVDVFCQLLTPKMSKNDFKNITIAGIKKQEISGFNNMQLETRYRFQSMF